MAPGTSIGLSYLSQNQQPINVLQQSDDISLNDLHQNQPSTSALQQFDNDIESNASKEKRNNFETPSDRYLGW